MFDINEIAFKYHKQIINSAIESQDKSDIEIAKEYFRVLLREFNGSWFNTASFIGCSLSDLRILI
ncbi:hypothetical protein UA38_12015 [Photobacterium kishitanii]|uniref:Uncharacterized protein n=2 Tax=Photobacterium kishitanii TaxID=318456 RepID=A0AAX0YR48_9GAMM|nr:hypothetical protein UA38_12015 [Photobacterium kishitanii]KJG60617.1 hypothetical protein UA42_14815 [Photobacterium kishitanii]KJG64919.1 hypothetical protein UA40_14510 [Photobacterium kishitanii]KJG66162.1 hypothetical protein UA41_21185 [Photobacterium kishitanii]PSX18289.1 hypothetical protein C0W70_15570 [Photobacterium kishitanii]